MTKAKYEIVYWVNYEVHGRMSGDVRNYAKHEAKARVKELRAAGVKKVKMVPVRIEKGASLWGSR